MNKNTNYVDQLIGKLRQESVEYFYVRKDAEFIFGIRTDDKNVMFQVTCSRKKLYDKRFIFMERDEYLNIAADFNWDAMASHKYDEYTYHYGQNKMHYPGGAK